MFKEKTLHITDEPRENNLLPCTPLLLCEEHKHLSMFVGPNCFSLQAAVLIERKDSIRLKD